MSFKGLVAAIGLAIAVTTVICRVRGEASPSASSEITFESGETQSSLVELFTSEGCSSCPRAEKWMSALKSTPDLWKKTVPVAFHVDYWDHLGWRDRFSKPEFTARQQHYAAAWNGDSVYTPGFVVNGKEWRNWLGAGPSPQVGEKVGKLRIVLNGDKLAATFAPATTQPNSPALNVALLGNDLESDVKSGENGGRKLRHDFVVLSLTTAQMISEKDGWSGTIAISPPASEPKPTAVAAWITNNGIPVQATGGWLR